MIKLKSYEIFNSESTENLKVSKCIHKKLYNYFGGDDPWGITIRPLKSQQLTVMLYIVTRL